ncbi:MAG TPA: SDR family oxidoreductase [Kofleriaceae bacterium]|jgi:3-oxoacyl-[acyl-carrier protein] reductase|nr:SDR family oxidoreductase [Kofleriaceae bacterium]
MSKVAIVTGASSGIGAASAVELARRGWSVVINYARSEDSAKAVAERCPDALVLRADVGDDAQCRALVQAALDRWGRIDALVNNAGTTKFVDHKNLDGLTGDDFLAIYRTNVVGAFQMTRACTPALKTSRGAIVNVSSVASEVPVGSSIAYGASKAALNMLTRSLARALGPEIRVNAVCPGYVDTPWHHNAHGSERANQIAAHYASMVPAGDFARSEDIADAIVWLIEGARQVTGEAIFVDGGLHVTPPR